MNPLHGSALLPTNRVDPFAPPPGLDGDPIRPMTMAGGNSGWLVTGYQLVREILADQRFSVDRRRMDNPVREIPQRLRRQEESPGMFVAEDPPQHTRYRKLLTGQFTVRRMRELTGTIESYVDERLDAMEAAGAPADLVELFALPVPSRVICELLGVDYDRRAEFQERTAKVLRLDTAPEDIGRTFDEIKEFMLELVRAKRRGGGDDMLTGLMASDPTLTDEEVSNMGLLLLIAGHETTANMLALGTFALLVHPDQFERLRGEPELLPGAVEELMRYLSILQFGTVRVANEDVEVGGFTVHADETVVLHLPQANRETGHVENPDTLDVSRDRVRHIGFGHGVHQCLGQQLARVEMVTGWGRLIARFPELRLAVPPEQVPLRTDMGIYGVHELPVTW